MISRDSECNALSIRSHPKLEAFSWWRPCSLRQAPPVSDLDTARSADLFSELHGDEATAKDREMVEEMRRKGDNDGADTWLRIIVAISEMEIPATEARH